MTRVTVVGAGVVGLTCAVALLDAGFDVEVVAAEAPAVSEVAGGLWLPYSTGERERSLAWAAQTREWLEDRGHPVVDYLHIERQEPWWLDVLPADRIRPATERELPPGRERAWVARVPLVQMPRHLAELRDRVGPIRRATVHDLADLQPPVVNAAGLAAARLAGDDDAAMTPARGQVVYVRAPAGTPCVCDEDELTYVLPREDVCVVGGTHQTGDTDTQPRAEDTEDILRRARALVPQLTSAPVIGARAGVRPLRRGGPRVEGTGDVVHCYGHGGAGVTLSYGCAQEVVRLLRS